MWHKARALSIYSPVFHVYVHPHLDSYSWYCLVHLLCIDQFAHFLLQKASSTSVRLIKLQGNINQHGCRRCGQEEEAAAAGGAVAPGEHGAGAGLHHGRPPPVQACLQRRYGAFCPPRLPQPHRRHHRHTLRLLL